MASRNSIVRGAKFCLLHALPWWTLANPSLSNAMFVLCLNGLGITDMASYLRRFGIVILPSAIFAATYGAASGGILGLIAGALAGIAAPGALIWLAITVLHAVAYLTVYCAAWVALFYCARWLFWSGF